ncbi:TOBE domain-containing protein [Erysipelothrix sp. Poltava]|nr:TOBE domain-containing protein [Erysipelothrix sp. Poltava]
MSQLQHHLALDHPKLNLGTGINEIVGKVVSVAYLGSCYQYQVDTECGVFKLCTQEKLQIDSVVPFRLDPKSIIFI